MKNILGQIDDSKLNQRQVEINTKENSFVSLPLKPPPSKRNSMIYDVNENGLFCRRQSIIIVEDYIASGDGSRRLHSRISITDFKRQLSKKKSCGQIIQYKPRYCGVTKYKNKNEERDKAFQGDTKLLQPYLVKDETNTSLDNVVELLEQQDNQYSNRDADTNTITRCVMCNRILYDLIQYEESDKLRDCVCSNCIKSYNSMIETINSYNYLNLPTSDDINYNNSNSNNNNNNNGGSKEFSNKLKKSLRDLLKQ